MGYINTTFLGKEYSIPADVLTYIDLLAFTESIQKQLTSAFVRKLRNEIAKDNIGLLGDEDLAAEIEQQVGKFIAKLCDNGIFTRTISDYLKNNKGYQLYSQVNKAALEKMRSLLIQEMDAWQAGYENAVNKAESHVTGMGFSIWSSSFVNHAIYAAMEASTLNKQTKEAESQYQKDMDDLHSRLDSQYGGEKSNYINNTYIPNMEAALTVFAYELLDKYVADLIANGKFDSKTLNYVDIGRSNDLLKNLTLSNNKRAILENAFSACPYNIAVYMQAMKYDLLDYDSFQTAKMFKQDLHVLSFFRETWGEVAFPTKFNINYHCINVWASLTGKSSADLLRGLTDRYATGIVKAYSRVADMLSDRSACHKIVGAINDDVLLLGKSICKGKAREYVEPIVAAAIWEQMTERCGHTDLLDRIKNYFPSTKELKTKNELDGYVIEQLTSKFEEVRIDLVAQIKARRAEEERQRIEQERKKAEQARIQAEKKAKRNAAVKKGIKRTLIVFGGIVAVCIALVIAGIIFLFATDKPIDNDFAERKEYDLHALTYYVPENWVEDSEFNQTNENTKFHVRYDNWGNYICMIGIVYHGETQHISIEDIVSDYTSEYNDAVTKSKQIREQEFTVINYVRTQDSNICNVYVTEVGASIFEIYFRSIPENTNTVIFDEIVGAIAFDDYVNPKEDTYAEAIGFMSAEKYDEAILMFTELDGYKDSVTLMAECQEEIRNIDYSKAIEMIASEDYGNAYKILVSLRDYRDCKTLLGRFKIVYGKSVVSTDSKTNYYEYSYDAEGYVILENYNDGTMVTEYTYDAQHNLITAITTFDSGEQLGTTYFYNSDGDVIQTNYVNYHGELTTTVYYYSNGNLSMSIATEEDGSTETTWYTYDSNNLLVHEVSHTVNEYHPAEYPYESTIDYSYFEDGRLKTETWTFDDGDQSTTEYIYDENGFLIREQSDSHDDHTDYVYDKNYILIEENRYSDGEKKSSTIYSDFYVYYNDSYVNGVTYSSIQEQRNADGSWQADLDKLKAYASYIQGPEANVLRDYPNFEDDGNTYYLHEDHLFEIEGQYKFEYFEGQISSLRFTWVPTDWHADEEYVLEYLKRCFGNYTKYTELLENEWFCYSWEYALEGDLVISYYIAEDEGEILIRANSN